MRIAFAVVALAACGSDSGSTPDAMPDAYDSARCLIKGNYGALGSVTGTAGMMGGTTMTSTLDAGPPRDTFFLKLVTGKGVFAGGLATGTYTIAGVDAQFLNCGLCVHIIADIVTGSGPTKFYFAQSGMVTLTSTSPPIAGSAQDLSLVEVDIGTGAPIAGGCTASIDSVSFSTM
jgi:hypothetical protein